MSSLRHLWPYLFRYKGMLIVGILCALIGASVAALGPYLLRLAVDDISAGQIMAESLLRYGGLLILVTLIDGGFKFAQRMLLAGASYRVEYDLRQSLFERYLSLDQAFFGASHTGDLMARATNDLSTVRQFLGPGLNGSATAILTFLASAALMLTIDVGLALVVLLLMPLCTVVFVLVGGACARSSAVYRISSARSRPAPRRIFPAFVRSRPMPRKRPRSPCLRKITRIIGA